jgi:teichoic acid transport system permease protein
MVLVIPPHATVTWHWALFPLVFLLQLSFNTGLILYAARITSAIPDLRMVFSFVSRFWMYGSGVMYSIERFVTHPTALAVMELNPAYCVLEMSRDLLIYQRVPELGLWLTLGAWALVTPVLGFLYFWQGEEEYGRE